MTRTQKNHRVKLGAIWLAAASSQLGCGAGTPQYRPTVPPPAASAGVAAPDSPIAAEILKRLDELPDEASLQTGAGPAYAGTPYTSASGRKCRPIRLPAGPDGKVEQVLACRDQAAWFYVPQVLSENQSVTTATTAARPPSPAPLSAPVAAEATMPTPQGAGETDTP